MKNTHFEPEKESLVKELLYIHVWSRHKKNKNIFAIFVFLGRCRRRRGRRRRSHLLNDQLLLPIVSELVGLEGTAVIKVCERVDVDQSGLKGAESRMRPTSVLPGTIGIFTNTQCI